MLNRLSLSILSVVALTLCAMPAKAQNTTSPAPQKVYELRIYTCNEGKLDALNARFREHSMRILARHGIESMYYWTVSQGAGTDGTDAPNMLVYIVAHKSREAADKSWEAFRADPEWVAVKAKSEEAGPLLSKPPVSVFMEATSYNPPDEQISMANAPPRLFELRKYNDGEARVPGTVERFGGWEGELFRQRGAQTLAFWTATDKSAFIYLLAYKDAGARGAVWNGFGPAFQEAQAAYNARMGRGATPAPARGPASAPAAGGARRGGRGGGAGSENRLLVPTDYSPRK